MESTSISGLLLKVASRCNLNCDYCYVYRHADQSWRQQPALISDKTVDLFITRVAEFVRDTDRKELSIIFHGGEPLLYGSERIAAMANRLRQVVGPSVTLDMSIQTNGVLLDEIAIGDLLGANVGVSISIDGPRHAHDRHRLTHSGESSFDDTLRAVSLLRTVGSKIFNGAIAVIDPAVRPKELFDFVRELALPRFDVLLPDATHDTPPNRRGEEPRIYADWLCEALQIWSSEYPEIPIRWFDSLLAAPLGVPCSTDVMGFGNVSLLVVETDGSITDHDVFKIVGEGSTSLGCNLEMNSLLEASRSSRIKNHAGLLQFAGLADECKRCPAVTMCAGGAVMHRYKRETGYVAPTVYCREMFLVLTEAARIVRHSLQASVEDLPLKNPVTDVNELLVRWTGSSSADRSKLSRWDSIRIHPSDPQLFAPFQKTITRCEDSDPKVAYFRSVLPEVECLLRGYSEDVASAIGLLITDICVVNSLVEGEEGIFSFSDDSVPDVIYLSTHVGGEPLPAEDIADSIYHEYLHHVLYHHQREHAILYENEHPRFPAPWTSGLRPSVGFFHGTFVFSHLSQFWNWLASSAESPELRRKAKKNYESFKDQARYGIATLLRFGMTTRVGDEILHALQLMLGHPDHYPWPQLQ